MNNQTRRDFLKRSTLAASVGAALASRPGLLLGNTGPDLSAYRDLDATDIAALVRSGELNPVDVVKQARQAIEELNPQLNAVWTTFYDHALELAAHADRSRPFAGVPYLIKDLTDYQGYRTTFGARAFKDNISKESAPFAQAAVASGLIPLGKSSTPEYGSLPTTEPLAFGPTRNPWNLAYSAGGSSGGSAAAVAAGMVPIALSSDGGGSIRIPASNCGIFGLKVSRGRNVGASNSPFQFGVLGANSRSVRDSAAHLFYTQQQGSGAMLAPVAMVNGPAKKRLKIGLIIEGIGNVMPSNEVEEAVRQTASLCQQLGHTIVEARFPESVIKQGNSMMDARATQMAGLGQRMEKMLGRPADEREFEPWTLQQFEHAASLSEQETKSAMDHIRQQAKDVNAMFNDYDVLLMPVLATRAVKLGWLESASDISFQEMLNRNQQYVTYTTAFNISGDPAMSVPLYWTKDGIPIGSQIAAGMGQEETLLALAYELEMAQPWKDRHPPVSLW